jgi:hypothetical protein
LSLPSIKEISPLWNSPLQESLARDTRHLELAIVEAPIPFDSELRAQELRLQLSLSGRRAVGLGGCEHPGSHVVVSAVHEQHGDVAHGIQVLLRGLNHGSVDPVSATRRVLLDCVPVAANLERVVLHGRVEQRKVAEAGGEAIQLTGLLQLPRQLADLAWAQVAAIEVRRQSAVRLLAIRWPFQVATLDRTTQRVVSESV